MSQFSVRLYNGELTPIEKIIDLADRQLYALSVLPVKLRELDQACLEHEQAATRKMQLHRECEQLMIEISGNADEMKRKLYR